MAGDFFSFGGPEPDKNFPKVVTYEADLTFDPSVTGLNRALGSLFIGLDSGTGNPALFQKQNAGGGNPHNWAIISGGGGGGGALPATFTATNTGNAMIVGAASSVNTSGGGLQPALADGTRGPPYVLGVASTAIAHNASGTFNALGPVTYSGAEITALIGSATFTPNTQYFVNDVGEGTWTDTPPSGGGGYAVPIAVALTTTIAFIQIGQPLGPL